MSNPNADYSPDHRPVEKYPSRDAIRMSLPWFANINWAGVSTASVLVVGPDFPHGIRVSVSDVEEARLLVSLSRHGGGMYHQVHVTGFAN